MSDDTLFAFPRNASGSERITASHWGLVHPQVADGRLTGLIPYAGDYAPSPNLAKLAALSYSANRIRKPAVREGGLSAGAAMVKAAAVTASWKWTGIRR